MNFVEAMAEIDDGKIASNNFDNNFYAIKNGRAPDNLLCAVPEYTSDALMLPLKWFVVDSLGERHLKAKWRVIDL